MVVGTIIVLSLIGLAVTLMLFCWDDQDKTWRLPWRF